MIFLLLDVLIACLLDLIIGDPKWLPHPVNFIGFLIKRVEKKLLSFSDKKIKFSLKTLSITTIKRQQRDRGVEIFLGFILLVVVVFSVSGIISAILYLANILSIKLMNNNILFHIFNIYFIFTAMATKSLAVEVLKVFKSIDKGDILEARKNISYLVSRETETLTEREIIKAAIETTSENTVDGVISPLFYAIAGCFFVGSAPLVYVFKAISTLDSIVGYMNEKYIHFGFASAKADDIANYIPARITGFFIVLAAFIARYDYSNSLRILLRDRRNHKSPNCAYPESAFAGALNIKLGGSSVYFGKVIEKPTIGDDGKVISNVQIKDSIRLMYLTFLIGLIILISFAFLFVSNIRSGLVCI